MNGSNALQALENGNFRAYYIDNNGREGLFINLQAIAILFLGNEAWVLRIVSALFGVLAVAGIYFLARELFRENPKSEALNSKQIINLKSQNSKQFWIWNFSAWNLFRISNLGFRILTSCSLQSIC